MLKRLLHCEKATIQDLQTQYNNVVSFENIIQVINRRFSELTTRRASLSIMACKLSLTALRFLQRIKSSTAEEDINESFRKELTRATEQQVQLNLQSESPALGLYAANFINNAKVCKDKNPTFQDVRVTVLHCIEDLIFGRIIAVPEELSHLVNDLKEKLDAKSAHFMLDHGKEVSDNLQ